MESSPLIAWLVLSGKEIKSESDPQAAILASPLTLSLSDSVLIYKIGIIVPLCFPLVCVGLCSKGLPVLTHRILTETLGGEYCYYFLAWIGKLSQRDSK